MYQVRMNDGRQMFKIRTSKLWLTAIIVLKPLYLSETQKSELSFSDKSMKSRKILPCFIDRIQWKMIRLSNNRSKLKAFLLKKLFPAAACDIKKHENG